MVPEGVREGWMDQVPQHQSLVSHLDKQLLPALVRLARGRELTLVDGSDSATGVSVIKGDEVGEEGKKIFVFWKKSMEAFLILLLFP